MTFISETSFKTVLRLSVFSALLWLLSVHYVILSGFLEKQLWCCPFFLFCPMKKTNVKLVSCGWAPEDMSGLSPVIFSRKPSLPGPPQTSHPELSAALRYSFVDILEKKKISPDFTMELTGEQLKITEGLLKRYLPRSQPVRAVRSTVYREYNTFCSPLQGGN